MGQKVLIIGQSGTGKSTSLRNFAKDEVCLIKTINKQLPFRGKFEETYVTDKATEIVNKMKATDKKVVVIDDAQYVMGNEFFRRALEKGYDKFSDIGKNFFDILSATDYLPEDVIVYFLLHTETDNEGNIKVKTIGRMLDEKLTVEGTATIVLMSKVVDGVYTFQTQNSGHDVCKSPMGMFQNYLIDNDLKMVDGIIREYYELSDVVVEEKGVSADKPTRASRRQKAAEKQAEETLNQIAGKPYVPTNDTIPPLDEEPVEEKPKRRERKKIDDGLTDEQREAFKKEMEAKNKAYEEDMAKLPQRKKRDVTEISDEEVVAPVEDTRGHVVPQKMETADATPRKRTLAEKLAASGVNVPETQEEAPVRTRRRRNA